MYETSPFDDTLLALYMYNAYMEHACTYSGHVQCSTYCICNYSLGQHKGARPLWTEILFRGNFVCRSTWS